MRLIQLDIGYDHTSPYSFLTLFDKETWPDATSGKDKDPACHAQHDHTFSNISFFLCQLSMRNA